MSAGSLREAQTVAGIQLSGRFAWDGALTSAARRYTREPGEGTFQSLSDARRKAAAEVMRAQVESGFEYVTDGGFASLDLFSPFIDTVVGIKAGGNIDRYPGTRNSYYHTPLVNDRIRPSPGEIDRFLIEAAFPPHVKKKAILPSPAAFALACENASYPDRESIVRDFSEVLRAHVEALAARGYGYVQLTECFLPSPRFRGRVSEKMGDALMEGLRTIFDGFGGRSALYVHSADGSELLRAALDSGLTDIGFDFNTPPDAFRGLSVDKNVLLGVQNTTRKLPEGLLDEEPGVLAGRTREYLADLRLAPSSEVAVCPSQDYDGVQTYPQAVSRLRTLAKAFRLLEGGA